MDVLSCGIEVVIGQRGENYSRVRISFPMIGTGKVIIHCKVLYLTVMELYILHFAIVIININPVFGVFFHTTAH